MDKRRLIDQIAQNTYCSLDDFKDIVTHELKHMGLDSREYQEEINLFINRKIYEQRTVEE